MNCRICQTDLLPFLSFGQMPIANAFLLPDQYADEHFFELAVGFCPGCTMVQLLDQPAPEVMFHENYAYFSSISTRMAAHFQAFAQGVMGTRLPERNGFVVEIGSNDGILLRHFAAAGIRHLGVEPSANVAEAARAQGVETLCAFFDEALARQIREDKGPADAILAANVMCHIPCLHAVAAGAALLLKPEGVLIFATKFCEPEYFDYPGLKEDLEKEGVPVFLLETELGMGVPGAIRTRVEAFAETLREKKRTA